LQVDDGDDNPIVTILCKTCPDQHKEVSGEVMIKMMAPHKNSKFDYLRKKNFHLKKEYEKK
jgi:hypothetical protein